MDTPQTLEGAQERITAARRRAQAAYYVNHPTTAFRAMRKLAEDVLALCDELERLSAENDTRKRAYEDFIDDTVWVSDEGETETLSVNKALFGALIDAFSQENA